MSVYRYMAEFQDFPSALPTFGWLLRNWAARRGIPPSLAPPPKRAPSALSDRCTPKVLPRRMDLRQCALSAGVSYHRPALIE